MTGYFPIAFEDHLDANRGRIITTLGGQRVDAAECAEYHFPERLPSFDDILTNAVAVREALAEDVLKHNPRMRPADIDAVLDDMETRVWDEEAARGLTSMVLGSATVLRWWHHRRWTSSRQVICLSPALVDAFSRVEMTYPLSALDFPYPEFFLSIDETPDVYKDAGGELAGAYVSSPFPFTCDEDGDVRVRVACPDGETRMVTIAKYPEPRNLACVDTLVSFWPTAGSSMDVIQGSKNRLVFDVDAPMERTIIDLGKKMGVDTEREVLLYRLIFNTIMYMSSLDPDVEVREVTTRVRGQKKRAFKGQRIVVSRFRRTKVIYAGRNLETPAGTHAPPVGHLRRGHPRWQACGRGWSEHKLIFVKPVWVKGRGDGEAVAHVQKVEAEDGL